MDVTRRSAVTNFETGFKICLKVISEWNGVTYFGVTLMAIVV